MASNYDQKIDKSIIDLFKQHIINNESAEYFSKNINNRNNTVSIPNIDDISYDPVVTYIIIDKSGSMVKCKSDVIKGHKAMIDALRDSAITRNGAHYVSQYLFDTKLNEIHGPELLSSIAGDDNVALLSEDMYRPGGETYLYKSLYDVLRDLLTLIASWREEGSNTKINIALISDGKDTDVDERVDPKEIRSLFRQLQDKHILKSSVVVGLLNRNFSSEQLEKIREELGFSEKLECRQDNGKEIRSKFIMASQSAVARSQR